MGICRNSPDRHVSFLRYFRQEQVLMGENTNEIMSLDELAEYLKISKSTLYKLVQQGKFPGQKIGKQWRFHKNAVDDWLRENPLCAKGK